MSDTESTTSSTSYSTPRPSPNPESRRSSTRSQTAVQPPPAYVPAARPELEVPPSQLPLKRKMRGKKSFIWGSEDNPHGIEVEVDGKGYWECQLCPKPTPQRFRLGSGTRHPRRHLSVAHGLTEQTPEVPEKRLRSFHDSPSAGCIPGDELPVVHTDPDDPEHGDAWVSKRVAEYLQTFELELEQLGVMILLGDLGRWKAAAEVMRRRAGIVFEVFLEREGRAEDKERHMAEFMTNIRDRISAAQAAFESDTEKKCAAIDAFVHSELNTYGRLLAAPWDPRAPLPEKEEMSRIIDFSARYEALEAYLVDAGVALKIVHEKLRFIRAESENMKKEFKNKYERAVRFVANFTPPENWT